jgi:mRNA interferase RelE/StbE
MPTYRVVLTRGAERGLRSIRRGDPAAYRRVTEVLVALAADPRPRGVTKLVGVEPPAWRLRVGEYRVVYEVSEREVVVTVIAVAPRGEVYR